MSTPDQDDVLQAVIDQFAVIERAARESYIAAERERCARLFDVPAHAHGEIADWHRETARRIRESAPQPEGKA